jgi:hypothetical protein
MQPPGLAGPKELIVPANTVNWVRLSTAKVSNTTGRYRAAWLMIDLAPESERVVRRVRVIFRLLVFQLLVWMRFGLRAMLGAGAVTLGKRRIHSHLHTFMSWLSEMRVSLFP